MTFHNNAIIICQKELTEILRDKRSLLQLFGVPLLACPITAYFWFILKIQSNPDLWIMWCQFFAAVPLFLIMAIGISITTGEKERNTMETSLTACISRKQLIAGKYLSLALINLALTVAMFFSICIGYYVSKLFPQEQEPVVSSLFQKLAICYWIYSGMYILLFSSFIILIGLFARNTKEATGLASALFVLVAFFPAIAIGFGLKLTWVTIFLPVLNCSLVCFAFFNSSPAWYFLILLFFTTVLSASISIYYAVKLIESDTVLSPP